MIADHKTLREAALQLPSQERIELIRDLELSLESDALAADRAAFTSELDRRWEHYLQNPESAVTAEEFFQRLDQKLGRAT